MIYFVLGVIVTLIIFMCYATLATKNQTIENLKQEIDYLREELDKHKRLE